MTLKDKRISTIIKLSRQAFKGYKLQVIILVLLGFLNGLLGGIGVNAVIPLLSSIMGEAGQELDFVSELIRKFFAFVHLDFSLKYLLIFICFLFVLKAIVLIITSYIRVRITASYEQKTRSALFKGFLKAHWPYLLKQKIGYLETILMRDISQSASLLIQLSTFIMTITSLLIYALIAFNISVTITLFTFGLGGVLFLCFKPLLYRTRLYAREKAATGKEVAHFINEKIIGMKTIKAMSAESPVLTKGAQYFGKLKDLTIKALLMREIPDVLLQPVSLIFIAAVFAYSYLAGNFGLASFVVIVYLIQRIFSYFESAQASLHSISESIPYVKAAVSYKESTRLSKEKDGGTEPFKFKKILQFKNVNFFYDARKAVLSDLNFRVKKGEMAGIIGPSGAGKTTIVDLLLQFFVPASGKILIDGRSISTIKLKDWRKKVGYVSQDIFLINDTIEKNIKFYNDDISDEEMIESAKMANIYDFVQGLAEKFSTPVGERGVMLSAGQRQRIILARVLTRQPEILILDEATSALDNESEVLVQKAIKGFKGKKTVLVIAHRLSTVINCDKLLVLEKGRIKEEGPPNDLLKDKNSYFYKVYNIRE